MRSRSQAAFSLIELVIVMTIIATLWYVGSKKYKKESVDVVFNLPEKSVLKKYEDTLKSWGRKIDDSRRNKVLQAELIEKEDEILERVFSFCDRKQNKPPEYNDCNFMLFHSGNAIINGGVVAATPLAVLGYLDRKGNEVKLPQFFRRETRTADGMQTTYGNYAILFGVWFDATPKNVYFLETYSLNPRTGRREKSTVTAIVDGEEWKSSLQFVMTAEGGVVQGTLYAPPKDIPLNVVIYQQGEPFREYGNSFPKNSQINGRTVAVLVSPYSY